MPWSAATSPDTASLHQNCIDDVSSEIHAHTPSWCPLCLATGVRDLLKPDTLGHPPRPYGPVPLWSGALPDERDAIGPRRVPASPVHQVGRRYGDSYSGPL